MSSPTAPNPAERLREAARVLRLSLPATSLTLTQRTALAEFDLAVDEALRERGDLLDRVSVARAGAQAAIDAGDELQRALTRVRAHLELELETPHVKTPHIRFAVSGLDNLGVDRSVSAIEMARVEASL